MHFSSRSHWAPTCCLWLLISLCPPTSAATETALQCTEASIVVDCGKTPSAIWYNGILWVVFAHREHLYVVHSRDKGQHYSVPVRVNSAPETIETNGENRPKIALTDKAVIISWTRKTEGSYTGDIRFSRSTDGGKTFAQPKTMNDDGQLASHRFDSLIASPSGIVYLTWLDKRNKLKARERGKAYPGSAVYYTVSTDHGKTFSENFPVADNSCECCRIAVAPAENDRLAIFWRHIYPESTRDHAFAIVTPEGKIASRERATFDDWQIDACPHHGPDMGATTGGYHLAWFSNGKQQRGILYGFYDVKEHSARQVTSMDASAGASHPQVVQFGDKVYFAWKLFDGEQTRIQLATSNDSGKSWSDSRTLAVTRGASDHPFLLASEDNVYLTWHTQNEGFRVIIAEASTDDIAEASSDNKGVQK